MASSKGQGLQIALIVFVVLTVAMSVTSFLLYQKSNDLNVRLATATKAKEDADKKFVEATARLTTLKTRVGYPDSEFGTDNDAPGGQTLMSKVAEDMQKYQGDPANPTLTYKDALGSLAMDRAKILDELNQRKEDFRQLRAEFDKQRKIEATKIATHNTESEAAKAELIVVQRDSDNKLNAKDQEFQNAKNAESTAMLEKRQIQSDFDRATEKWRTREVGLTTQVTKFKEEVERTTSMGRSVATVVSVDNLNKQVYINVGEADRLPLRTTFSIWDRNKQASPHWKERDKKVKEDAAKEFEESNKRVVLRPRPEGGPKAYIEITNILGAHQSMGRITMDSSADPIAPGDKVYGIWEPGAQKHFALVGRFDLTGRDTNDRALLKDIIQRDGGVIDAEVLEDGEEVGEIRVGTHWLVLGKLPEVGDEDDPQAKHAEKIRMATSKFQTEAKKLGVEIIDQHKLYDYMGFAPHSHRYELGSYTGGPQPSSLRYENPTSSSRPSTMPTFETKGGSSRPTNLPGKSNYNKK